MHSSTDQQFGMGSALQFCRSKSLMCLQSAVSFWLGWRLANCWLGHLESPSQDLLISRKLTWACSYGGRIKEQQGCVFQVFFSSILSTVPLVKTSHRVIGGRCRRARLHGGVKKLEPLLQSVHHT